MEDPVRELEQGKEAWRRLGWPPPQAVLVTGSGLGVGVGRPAHGPVPLAELLPFPVQRVEGHAHTAEILLPRPERPVLYLKGRLHAYQGYGAHRVVYPVRLAGLLGARVVIMTNAAGGLDPAYAPGQLKLVADQLNLMGMNPLRGELPPGWGPRFPDLSDAYDPALARLVTEVARGQGLELGEAVYAGLPGPSYETPAEVRMLQRLGAELVGMSTVLEVIAARHLGMRCACLSLVTNLACGVAPGPLSHEEVLETGRAAAEAVTRLLAAVLAHPRLL